jgi:hypothetical protein
MRRFQSASFLILSAVIAAGAQAPPEIERVYVPAERLSALVPADTVVHRRSRREFEALLARYRRGLSDAEVRIPAQVEFSATFDPSRRELTGTATWKVPRGPGAEILLGPVSFGLEGATSAPPAEVISGAGGGLRLRAASEREVSIDTPFFAPGTVTPSGVIGFELELPPAARAALELAVPSGWTARSDTGEAAVTGPSKGSWRFGGRPALVLELVPLSVEPGGPTRAISVEREFRLTSAGVRERLSLTVTALAEEPGPLRLDTDADSPWFEFPETGGFAWTRSTGPEGVRTLTAISLGVRRGATVVRGERRLSTPADGLWRPPPLGFRGARISEERLRIQQDGTLPVLRVEPNAFRLARITPTSDGLTELDLRSPPLWAGVDVRAEWRPEDMLDAESIERRIAEAPERSLAGRIRVSRTAGPPLPSGPAGSNASRESSEERLAREWQPLAREPGRLGSTAPDDLGSVAVPWAAWPAREPAERYRLVRAALGRSFAELVRPTVSNDRYPALLISRTSPTARIDRMVLDLERSPRRLALVGAWFAEPGRNDAGLELPAGWEPERLLVDDPPREQPLEIENAAAGVTVRMRSTVTAPRAVPFMLIARWSGAVPANQAGRLSLPPLPALAVKGANVGVEAFLARDELARLAPAADLTPISGVFPGEDAGSLKRGVLIGNARAELPLAGDPRRSLASWPIRVIVWRRAGRWHRRVEIEAPVGADSDGPIELHAVGTDPGSLRWTSIAPVESPVDAVHEPARGVLTLLPRRHVGGPLRFVGVDVQDRDLLSCPLFTPLTAEAAGTLVIGSATGERIERTLNGLAASAAPAGSLPSDGILIASANWSRHQSALEATVTARPVPAAPGRTTAIASIDSTIGPASVRHQARGRLILPAPGRISLPVTDARTPRSLRIDGSPAEIRLASAGRLETVVEFPAGVHRFQLEWDGPLESGWVVETDPTPPLDVDRLDRTSWTVTLPAAATPLGGASRRASTFSAAPSVRPDPAWNAGPESAALLARAERSWQESSPHPADTRAALERFERRLGGDPPLVVDHRAFGAASIRSLTDTTVSPLVDWLSDRGLMPLAIAGRLFIVRRAESGGPAVTVAEFVRRLRLPGKSFSAEFVSPVDAPSEASSLAAMEEPVACWAVDGNRATLRWLPAGSVQLTRTLSLLLGLALTVPLVVRRPSLGTPLAVIAMILFVLGSLDDTRFPTLDRFGAGLASGVMIAEMAGGLIGSSRVGFRFRRARDPARMLAGAVTVIAIIRVGVFPSLLAAQGPARSSGIPNQQGTRHRVWIPFDPSAPERPLDRVVLTDELLRLLESPAAPARREGRPADLAIDVSPGEPGSMAISLTFEVNPETVDQPLTLEVRGTRCVRVRDGAQPIPWRTRADGGVEITPVRVGRQRLVAELTAPIIGGRDRQGLAIGLPPLLRASVRGRLPAGAALREHATSPGVRADPSAGPGVIVGRIAGSRGLRLGWRAAESAMERAAPFARIAHLIDARDGSMVTGIRLQAIDRLPESLELELPRGYTPHTVTGPAVIGWRRLADARGANRLSLSLDPPAGRAETSLRLTGSAPLAGAEIWRVPLPIPLGASVSECRAGVIPPSGAIVEGVESDRRTARAGEEFRRAWNALFPDLAFGPPLDPADTAVALAGVDPEFAWSEARRRLSLRLTPTAPRLDVRQTIELGPERAGERTFEVTATLTATAPMPVVLSLPAEWRLSRVRSTGGAVVLGGERELAALVPPGLSGSEPPSLRLSGRMDVRGVDPARPGEFRISAPRWNAGTTATSWTLPRSPSRTLSLSDSGGAVRSRADALEVTTPGAEPLRFRETANDPRWRATQSIVVTRGESGVKVFGRLRLTLLEGNRGSLILTARNASSAFSWNSRAPVRLPGGTGDSPRWLITEPSDEPLDWSDQSTGSGVIASVMPVESAERVTLLRDETGTAGGEPPILEGLESLAAAPADFARPPQAPSETGPARLYRSTGVEWSFRPATPSGTAPPARSADVLWSAAEVESIDDRRRFGLIEWLIAGAADEPLVVTPPEGAELRSVTRGLVPTLPRGAVHTPETLAPIGGARVERVVASWVSSTPESSRGLELPELRIGGRKSTVRTLLRLGGNPSSESGAGPGMTSGAGSDGWLAAWESVLRVGAGLRTDDPGGSFEGMFRARARDLERITLSRLTEADLKDRTRAERITAARTATRALSSAGPNGAPAESPSPAPIRSEDWLIADPSSTEWLTSDAPVSPLTSTQGRDPVSESTTAAWLAPLVAAALIAGRLLRGSAAAIFSPGLFLAAAALQLIGMSLPLAGSITACAALAGAREWLLDVAASDRLTETAGRTEVGAESGPGP